MTIPIYSNLKAKLEAKGLDARTSGQIAWFVCSVGICIFPIIFLYFDNNKNQIIVLFGMFFIFVLNLVHLRNFLPLLFVMIFYWIVILLQTNYYYLLIIFIIFLGIFLSMIFIKYKKYELTRFFVVFCLGIIYIILSFLIFGLLGGLVK